MTEHPGLIDQIPRERAVATFGRDVLVAASAGTGKTTVLTQRVMHALTAESLDVTRILVLTFTEAAAEEMRSRIAQQLRQACQEPDHARLRIQLRRLDAAPISTLHAFCKRTLDTYFYRADLDPNAQILDEDQGRLLRSDCLQQALGAAWAEKDRAGGLYALFDGRSPDSVLGHVQEVARFLEGVSDPVAWLTQASEQLGRAGSPSPDLQSRWLGAHLDTLEQQLALALLLDRSYCEERYLTPLIREQITPVVDACRATWAQEGVAAARQELDGFKWPRLPGGKSPWSQDTRDRVKQALTEARRTYASLTGAALMNPAYGKTYGPAECEQGRTLLDLVGRLRDSYRQAKQERRVLDYADLEHRLLALLETAPEVGETLRGQYDAVLVDEYQDVNAVQQAILDHVRRHGVFFAVGDVKQSIYGFRQARPKIFLEALNDAGDSADSAAALRLDLQTNFRCRPEILAFVNATFARLMEPGLGGVRYDERATLLPGRGTAGTIPVEVAVLDSCDDSVPPENLGGITQPQRQAAWIATRIGQLISHGVTVPDRSTGQERALTYGDIVILLRSPAGRAHHYAEILRLAGIPVSSQSSAGYFASTEVLDTLALLRVLDNPHQDIELGAVLRSALLGFTDVDLAEIQLHRRAAGCRSDFCGAVRLYASEGPQENLKARLAHAFNRLEKWRNQVRRGRLADMLWEVFRSTGYLSFVSALPNGAQRRANLLKFHDRAMQFQSEGNEVSLGGFVAFLEGLLEQRQDWAPAEPDSACVDAVRIMSIHRSKGLEFPVVFLADLEHRFNLSAAQGACLTDETLGLGLAVADAAQNIAVKSPTHEVIALQRRDQDLAEELRILYVAVTRARERLILCGCQAPEQTEKQRDLGRVLAGQTMPATVLRGAHCILDWLNHAVPAGAVDYRQVAFTDLQTMAQTLMDRQQALLAERRALADCDPAVEQDLVAELAHSCSQSYAYASAVTLAAKQSVSDLTHRDDAFSRLDLERALSRAPLATRPQKRSARPGRDARERGTALHLVMETLAIAPESPPTVRDIHQHTQDLTVQGRIRATAIAEADIEAIFRFFHGPTGSQCFAVDAQTWREWPFTLALPQSEEEPSTEISAHDTDFVIVQGIVDLLIERPDGILVVDYKTDTLGPGQLDERVASYRGQLDLYARAVEDILQKPVLGKVLYFTSLNQEVRV